MPREEWDEAIPFLGLYGADGRLKSNCAVDWAVKLKLNVSFREHHFTNEFVDMNIQNGFDFWVLKIRPLSVSQEKETQP